MVDPILNTFVENTRLTRPRLAFGTAPLRGPIFAPQSVEEAQATLQYAFTRGLTYIDTAPFYGAGETEDVIGSVVSEHPRHTLTIETKAGRLAHPIDHLEFDFTRDGIRRSVERSLAKIRVDYLDAVLIHDADDHFRQALDEALPALHDLKQQGVVKAVGAGMNQWPMLHAFAQHGGFDCFLLAGRYTLLEQGALPLLKICAEKGIDLMLGGVFNSGILATGNAANTTYNYTSPDPATAARVVALSAICARFGVTLAAVALQFAEAPSAVTSLVVGLKSPAEIDTLLTNWQMAIPTELWDTLRADSLIPVDSTIPSRPSPLRSVNQS